MAHLVIVPQTLMRGVEQLPEGPEVPSGHGRLRLPHACSLGDHMAEPSREHLWQARSRRFEHLVDRGLRPEGGAVGALRPANPRGYEAPRPPPLPRPLIVRPP